MVMPGSSEGRSVTDLDMYRIAVLIPCYNEKAAIGKVVADFKAAIPGATVYVYDNNSSDATREVAARAGAIVRTEPRQGKGNVVRRMFSDIEADVYILVDGDDTYDATAAPSLTFRLIDDGLDMVNAARQTDSKRAYRAGHRFGNWILTGLVARIFGNQFTDMLSGYRVFSRRYVKSFPALSKGFEIETELTVHALELAMPTSEISTRYGDRHTGSVSKLRTVRDGIRILTTILLLVRDERPFAFFGFVALVLAVTSIAVGAPVVVDYLQTGLVPRLPTAVLATGLMLLSFLSFVCGLILGTVTLGRREAKRMRYLAIPGVSGTTIARLSGQHRASQASEIPKAVGGGPGESSEIRL